MLDQFFETLQRISQGILFVVVVIAVVALAIDAFRNRGMPRVGGKIGRRTGLPGPPAPDGFSRVDSRNITIFVPTSDAAPYKTLRAYAREGTVPQQGLVHVYRVAACNTRIEIPAEPPGYPRIDAVEALALLRELPDPRLVHRLHLTDEPSFLDPWVRKVTGLDIYSIGNASIGAVIVLYRPDRRLGRELGLTLLHEWLHLVAFQSAKAIRRFKRADAIEVLPPLAYEPVSFGDRQTAVYEAWCVLGEKVLGYDESAARQAALASPVHTMILWQRIEKILRKAPTRLASTRLDEFKARDAFIRLEVSPKARAVRRQNRWWRRRRSTAAP